MNKEFTLSLLVVLMVFVVAALGFAALDEEELVEAVRRMAKALRG